MRDLEITIYVEERAGLARETSAVRIGVPFSRGSVFDDDHLVVAHDSGKSFPHQAQPLAHWSDGSIKWLLVDILVRLAARQRLELRLKSLGQATVSEQPDGTRASEGLAVRQEPSGIEVDTGVATFRFDRAVAAPVAGVKVGGRDLLTATGAALKLTGVDGRVLTPKLERMYVAQQGPLTTAVIVEGVFADGANGLPMSWRSRAFLTAGSAAVQLEIRVRNPRAARHAGGLWDLGDPGSWLFKDLSVCLHPATPVRELRWYAEGPGNESTEPAAPWTLYQDSSGGEQWNCDNHLDRNGKLSVSVRGYQIRRGADLGGEGLRATPCLLAVGESGWVSATVCDFWQNFPKALRWQDDALCIGLFPGECAAGFELQGGEQKRHTLLCDFGEAPRSSVIEQLQAPPAVWIEPAAVERSKAVPYLIAREASSTPELYAYIDGVIAGPRSFQARREIIDEYGWRNFGDLYADHEAVNDRSARPFISHYNNQYDFIYGGLVHYLASGELRWRELAEASARHVVDIDIYHTGQDKAAFNGGLFWHTDHYRPARTCTHRTYSRHNLNGSAYGGGPSNEHNYTSGLLLHHYLSGDAESAQAVRELADWVIAMDDGSRTLLGLFDASRTGHASSTVTPAYHKPGRGAGNSINALLDAYALTLD